MEKRITPGKMGQTWKNRVTLLQMGRTGKKADKTEKRIPLGQTWKKVKLLKNWSHLEKWVTLTK